MKVTIKNKPGQYSLVAIVSEEVEKSADNKSLMSSNKEIKGVAYVFDKERKAHKFLAEDIERYD